MAGYYEIEDGLPKHDFFPGYENEGDVYGAKKKVMSKYSALSLIRHAFSNNKNWQLAIKDAEPKKSYDAIIVSGGGHGLASAYYLAKNHNLKNIAVVEKGLDRRWKYSKKYHDCSIQLFVDRGIIAV